MDDFERRLRAHAVCSGVPISVAPVRELLALHRLTFINAGIFHRVYRIGDTPWVMKEGRWDIRIPLAGKRRMPVPARMIDALLRTIRWGFLPHKAETQRQHDAYLHSAEYLGFFEDANIPEPDGYPEYAQLSSKQRVIRESLIDRIPTVERMLGTTLPPDLRTLLAGPVRFHNFLPREYLLYGEAVSPAGKKRHTSFIIQEYVPGKKLHDAHVAHEPRHTREALALFAFLMLLLMAEKQIVPDTRPRNFLTQMHDWMSKTDNIILAERGVTFVDTRWHWHTDAGFIHRGVWIPALVRRSALLHLREWLKEKRRSACNATPNTSVVECEPPSPTTP